MPSPLLTHSVPSEAARTVPIEWVNPSEGMQSIVLSGSGHGPPVSVPRIGVSANTWFSAFTLTRRSWETISPDVSAGVPMS